MTRLSIVVPAYNEERVLGDTLAALARSLEALDVAAEIIVADDDSTDRTAAIAADAGARVVPTSNRQIAATRNAGAAAATGDLLLFIDADTIVPPETIRAALAAHAAGAVGGGARVRFDDRAPLVPRAIMVPFTFVYFTILRLAAGCFVFADRAVFERIGGFDERRYAGEECVLSRELRAEGRFTILDEHVITSSRKFHLYSPARMIWQGVVASTHFALGSSTRDGHGTWYDGKRE